MTVTAKRPYLKPRPYIWKDEDRTVTPGIGLMHGGQIRAHLTPAEAYELANQLVDLADHLESRQESEES
ncbi:hypothetical protein [Arthrobacter oryzae]|uniref:Uncharacterized protein n=1 Tax=Arthrobacter oryzae TaxID=409290 RepID=A0A3N0BRI1_9MICC|nr:hypothetical protein [Arthrobacter oryzae]RNL51585.1 hypothetical protein D7003_15770 [Arthrobacter oryzae]